MEACSKASEVAETFAPAERFNERRSAFVYTSNALLSAKQTQLAYDYANKAVLVVEQSHDFGSFASSAYTTRAQAEAVLGKLQPASDDLTKAEALLESAIQEAGPSAPAVDHQYKPTLKGLYKLHAQILSALHEGAEAQAKTAAAASL